MAALAPWQQRLMDRLAASLEAGRLPHALLFTGAPGLGKRALVDALVARLMCREPRGGIACGACRDCTLVAAGSHPDLRRISFETREDGRLRTEIRVDQVRAASAVLSLTPQRGGAVVAVIDPAEGMNASARNALLKTLEEPQPNRFLVLVSDRPGVLPATVRSRCQRWTLVAPSREEAQDWLAAQAGGGRKAAALLELADHNPGLAAAWAEAGVDELLPALQQRLVALAARRQGALATAREWLDDRPELRLRLLVEAVRALGRGRAGRGGALLDPAFVRLTAASDFNKLAAWCEAADRTRRLLDTTVRSDWMLAELLLQWPAAAAAPAAA